MSIYGSEDGEITTDKEQEKEEKEEENGKKKVIFKRIWPNSGKKPRKATFKSAAFDFIRATEKLSFQGVGKNSSLGFKMKIPEGYCTKIYGRSGMTANHECSFGRWHFHNGPRYPKLRPTQGIQNQSQLQNWSDDDRKS